jgi:L-fuculose-phosphate aldolase
MFKWKGVDYMQLELAKQTVVNAGVKLVESGLIARTWGNVSCRFDKDTFVITPSGRPYETLKPEEIVLCKVEDCSYEGEIKPSSEKKLHALIYQMYPEINFVIHTHQKYASVLSASGLKSIPIMGYPLLGDEVRIAEYGLPGTAKLRKGVEQAILGRSSHAVIMAHHGAVCFGKDYEETFTCAKQLEAACVKYISDEYLTRSKDKVFEEERLYQYYVTGITKQNISLLKIPSVTKRSRRTERGFIYENPVAKEYCFSDAMPTEVEIHRRIYEKRPDINFIDQDFDMALVALSQTGNMLKPLLDDFAQLVGTNARCAKSLEAGAVVEALRGRYGALLPGAGAICCAASETDLQAVHIVMEKNAKTQIGAWLLGGGKALSSFDCKLMNFVYKKSYAKKAKEA